MKVECHAHSNNSDGGYSVEELVKKVIDKNIEVFALTDHDTIAGVKLARKLCKDKIKFVSGVEFTTREMFVNSIKNQFCIHLLGYNFDENNTKLIYELNKRNKNADKAFERLCKDLSRKGYYVRIGDIKRSWGNILQLCDVKDHIIKKYNCTDESIFNMIESYKAELDRQNIPVKKAIDLIHYAGGKAVWAHPFCVYEKYHKSIKTKDEVKIILNYLKKLGLDGIEAHYYDFEEEQRQWLYELSKSENLIYTAGSDFHGIYGRDNLGVEI